MTSFYFSTIQTDHTRATVTLLTIDGNLNTNFARDYRKLLSNDGALDLLSIDGNILVVIWPFAETCCGAIEVRKTRKIQELGKTIDIQVLQEAWLPLASGQNTSQPCLLACILRFTQ